MRFPLSLIATLALAACVMTPALRVASTDWRQIATATDRARMRDWRTAFTTALDSARKTGFAEVIAREGTLLDPDAAIGPVPIPNGRYKCRVIKLGGKSAAMLDFVAYPAFDCRVQQEKQLQSLAKLTGSQRHIGLLFPADAMRQTFLGTLVLGDEQRAMQYGRDPDRDLAGWVERVGERRWRLVLPYPKYESTLDVIELVPAP